MKYDSVLDQQSISGKIVSLILCVWKPCYVKSGHIYNRLYNKLSGQIKQNLNCPSPAFISNCICIYIALHTSSRHSSIRDFLIKKLSVYSPIEPWHKMTTRV